MSWIYFRSSASSAYCPGGTSCNGGESGPPLSRDAVAGWPAGAARNGLRGRVAAPAEAVVSCGCWDAAGIAGSEAMILMLGIEDADGKNSLLAGRTTTDVGEVGAALKLLIGETRVPFDLTGQLFFFQGSKGAAR
jgi:hypothetical protein